MFPPEHGCYRCWKYIRQKAVLSGWQLSNISRYRLLQINIAPSCWLMRSPKDHQITITPPWGIKHVFLETETRAFCFLIPLHLSWSLAATYSMSKSWGRKEIFSGCQGNNIPSYPKTELVRKKDCRQYKSQLIGNISCFHFAGSLCKSL